MKYKVNNKYIIDTKSPISAAKKVMLIRQVQKDSISEIAKKYNYKVVDTTAGNVNCICKLNSGRPDMTRATKLQSELQSKGYNARIKSPDVYVYDSKCKDNSASGMYRGVYYSYNFAKNKIDLYVNEELKKSFNLDDIKDIREVYEYIDKNYSSLIKDSKIKDYYDIKPGAIFKSTRPAWYNEEYIKVLNVKNYMVTYNLIIKQPNGQYTAFHEEDRSVDRFKELLSRHGYKPVSSLYDSKIKDEKVVQISELKKGDKFLDPRYNNEECVVLEVDIDEEGSYKIKSLSNNTVYIVRRNKRVIVDSVKDSDIEYLSKEEEQAIEDYKKAISNTKDPGLLRLFAHILKEEIEHLEELQNEEVTDSDEDEKSKLEAELESLERQWDRADEHNDEWSKAKINKQIEQVREKLKSFK